MHRNFLGGSTPEFISDAADIIIRSASHELRYSRAVKPLAYQSSAQLRLHEDEGWHLHGRGAGTAGSEGGSGEMQAVLADVRGLLIRGGFYRGPEITTLTSVVLSAAPHVSSSPESAATSSTSVGRAATSGQEEQGWGPEKGRWIPAKDPVSGRTYYWHSITKQSRWRIPKEEHEASQPSSSTTAASSGGRPGVQTLSDLDDARAQRQASSDLSRAGHDAGAAPALGQQPGATSQEATDAARPRRGRDDSSGMRAGAGVAAGGVEVEVGEVLAEGGGGIEEGSDSGLSEKERASVLLHAAGEEMVQARVSLQDGILAMTRTHMILVDRHCLLRADLRSVQSLDLSHDHEGGDASEEAAGFSISGMVRQQLGRDVIKSSTKACKQFEQLRERNTQRLQV